MSFVRPSKRSTRPGPPLIKHIGTGSYYTQAGGPGDLTFAAWDDDPGSYLIASLMGSITGSDSPVPRTQTLHGLARRPSSAVASAGDRTHLQETDRGLCGGRSATRDVVAERHTARRHRVRPQRLGEHAPGLRSLRHRGVDSVPLSFARALGEHVPHAHERSHRGVARYRVARGSREPRPILSGLGVAAAVGVLWWLGSKGRLRLLKALAAAFVAVLIAVGVQNGTMALINVQRSEATGISLGELPRRTRHLAPALPRPRYPQPITGESSPFGIIWSDEFGWEQARKIDPDVLIGGEDYDLIMKDLYLQEVLDQPVVAVKLYIKKALFVLQHFGGLVAFILVGFALVFARRVRQRRAAIAAAAIATPTLLLGLVPPVLVMPMLYYFSELSAAIGILAAVALGAIVWSLTPIRASDAIEQWPSDGTDENADASPALDDTSAASSDAPGGRTRRPRLSSPRWLDRRKPSLSARAFESCRQRRVCEPWKECDESRECDRPPCTTNRPGVDAFVARVEDVLSTWQGDFEIILVDDGSADESWARIEDIAAQKQNVRGLKLSRNFGKDPAMYAGARACSRRRRGRARLRPPAPARTYRRYARAVAGGGGDRHSPETDAAGSVVRRSTRFEPVGGVRSRDSRGGSISRTRPTSGLFRDACG